MAVIIDFRNKEQVWFGNSEASEVWIAGQKVWTKPVAYSYSEGFEVDAGGWTNRTVGVAVSRVTSPVRSGSGALFLNTTSNGTRRVGYNLTGLTVGKSYYCQAYVRTTQTSTVNSFFLGVEGIGNGSEVDPTSNVWTLTTYTFTATSTSHWLNVTFSVTNTSQDAYIDDVTVTET